MILHDWQRGRIPFFVPPPRQQDDGESPKESDEPNLGEDSSGSADQKSAAMRAIAGIISAQQVMNVPENKGFFGHGDAPEDEEPELPPAEDPEPSS